MAFPGLGEPFPEREKDILDLARRLIEAMERDPETFRDAPYTADQLRVALEQARRATAAADAADEVWRESIRKKDQTLQELKAGLIRGPWTIEVTVRGRPEKLSGIGWGGNEATDRVPPGAVRDFALGSARDGSVELQWRPP
ncbi:MAG TPA: hypothetical protein VNL18_16455, partial [Gemmatimonadales bacterium]|nr:hypothetical protein [Gemmatimonadales bacterium]